MKISDLTRSCFERWREVAKNVAKLRLILVELDSAFLVSFRFCQQMREKKIGKREKGFFVIQAENIIDVTYVQQRRYRPENSD